MQLLIDTHAILWFQSSDKKLTDRVKHLMLDKNNNCYVSIATFWEIAIKINLNKLTIGMPFEDFPEYLLNINFEILNLKISHLIKLSALDKHHGDPFDRLLISQAISENLTVISADKIFEQYPVNVTW